jgi:hypothetical protein
MATVKNSWIWVDLSPFPSAANTSCLVAKPCPVEGTIVEVWMSINTLLAAGGGIAALSKNTLNILSAASVDFETGFTAATAASKVLTTNTASLKVLTTDTLKAAYTLTTIATTNGVGCLVAIEPSYQ